MGKVRMEGFSSHDVAASTNQAKATQCPSGHRLKLLNIGYVPGSCDGCQVRMRPKDFVMDCRKCNWYLCQWCCPQTRPKGNALTATCMAAKVSQEVEDLKDVTGTFYTVSPLFATCRGGGGPGQRGVEDLDEIIFTGQEDGEDGEDGNVPPRTPAASSMTYATSTPPKTEAAAATLDAPGAAEAKNPEEHCGGSVDLLGLASADAAVERPWLEEDLLGEPL